MNLPTYFNMEMCRACLSQVELVPMDEKFINQYNMLNNLDVKIGDDPLYTCSKCFEEATFCFEFREKCIKSEETLQELLTHKRKAEEENLDEKILIVKKELKIEYIDDAELIDDCYNYGEDYVVPTTEAKHEKLKIRKPRGKYKKEKEIVDIKLNCAILNSKEELTEHLEKHKTDFACSLCKQSFISIPHILGHRMKHLPKEEKLCHNCSKKFISAENSEFHYMRVHEMAEKDAPILCKKCLKPFTSVKSLQKHALQHAEMKFVCDHCSKRFLTLPVLRIHIIAQHLPKHFFKCELCDFTTRYQNGIAAHKVTTHTIGNAVCKTCGRYFLSQDKLDKHKCKHLQPVICPICGISFQAKGRHTFNKHLKKHNQSNYKCTQCPSEFKSRDCFRAHMDKHAGTPRHQCITCNRCFYSRSSLHKHQRVHTGEKPYVCKICSRGFTGNNNLKVHMKVHGIHNLIKKKCLENEYCSD